MPADMSPEAITRRLRIAGELMRTCLELGKARPVETPPPAPAPGPAGGTPPAATGQGRKPKI